MDILLIMAGLGVAWGAIRWGMCWWDPVGADKMAARLRGRGVELRMIRAAKAEARQAAQKLEEAYLREWDQGAIGTISQTEETEHAR